MLVSAPLAQVIFDTCAPTWNALTSGEPEPIVHVKLDEPPLTLIDPPPSALIEKSPAIASDDVDELDDVDEDEEEPAPMEGCRRSMSSRTPSAHTTFTVEPTR